MALRPQTVKSIVGDPYCARVLIQSKALASLLAKPYLIVRGRTGRTRSLTREKTAMTTGANRIMDEFAKLMTDAAGAAQGVRKEIETAFSAQAERWLNGMDIVKREEFEAVREMAIKARDENDALLARIAALEAKLAAKGK
jgi:BMFP domain-containing protein YqiC